MNSGKVTTVDPKGMKTHSVWLFVADAVTGPYRQASAGPLTLQYNNDATLFADDDGQLWSGCHYFMDERRPYPYSQTFFDWEKEPQLGSSVSIFRMPPELTSQ